MRVTLKSEFLHNGLIRCNVQKKKKYRQFLFTSKAKVYKRTISGLESWPKNGIANMKGHPDNVSMEIHPFRGWTKNPCLWLRNPGVICSEGREIIHPWRDTWVWQGLMAELGGLVEGCSEAAKLVKSRFNEWMAYGWVRGVERRYREGGAH